MSTNISYINILLQLKLQQVIAYSNFSRVLVKKYMNFTMIIFSLKSEPVKLKNGLYNFVTIGQLFWKLQVNKANRLIDRQNSHYNRRIINVWSINKFQMNWIMQFQLSVISSVHTVSIVGFNSIPTVVLKRKFNDITVSKKKREILKSEQFF